MAQSSEDIKWLYGKLKAKGYDIGTEREFTESLSSREDRDWYYQKATSMGLDMGGREDFESLYAPEAAPAATAPPERGTEAQAGAAAPQWQPTGQDMARLRQAQGVADAFGRQARASSESMGRLAERHTAEGRGRLAAAGSTAGLLGLPTRMAGLTPPMPAPAGGGGAQTQDGAGARQAKSLESPVPHGVKMEGGKRVTEWLLPDGRTTTDLNEADRAEHGARRSRLEHEFARRMERNGLGPSAMEKDREAFEKRMRENDLDPAKQEDIDRQLAWDVQTQKGIDARSVASGINNSRIAETVSRLWDEAEAKHRGDEERSAKRHWDAYAAMGGGREMRVSTTAAARYDSDKSRLTRFDLKAMMDDMWARCGKDVSDDCYNELARQNPGMDENDLRPWADGLARQIIDSSVYMHAVEKNAPKSTLEYFGRQAADINLVNSISKGLARIGAGGRIGDLPAYEAAMGEYGGSHRMAQVGGTVFGMGIDPTTWASGLVGSMGVRAAMSAGGRILAGRAANGMTRQLGTRLFSSSLGGKAIAGAAGGAANFAAYEMAKEGERQFVYGGVLNPETLEAGDYSAGDVLKAGGHGLVMGSVTGTFAPLIGNVADKAVKATASTAGKAGVRVGEVAVSSLAEGTVFSVPEWISGEGDAFDVWTDNMAMMLGFKAQHGLKSAPRFIAGLRPVKEPKTQAERNRNRQSFEERINKALDELNYSKDERKAGYKLEFAKADREELRRAGYGELADLFGKDKPIAEATPTAKAEDGAIELRAERVEAEEINSGNPDFDGYSAMERLMEDGRVSEATRAKAYYILTGRMLPMSSVVGWNTTANEDGSIIVNSMNAQGDVVTSRVFKNKGEADAEASRIQRQAELNTIDIGEQHREAEADWMVFEAAINEVSPRADHATIREIYEKAKRGDKDVTEEQVSLVEMLDEAIDRHADAGNANRPEAMRSEIKNETGIDVDAALRKMDKDRSAEEREAVRAYAERLFPEKARRQAGPRAEEREAQRAYEEAKLLYGRFEEGSPQEQAEARAEMDGMAERYREALEGIEDAFGPEAEARMAEMQENPWDLLDDPGLTLDQQDAVLRYVNSKRALDGVRDAADESAEGKREAIVRGVEERTHRQSGAIQPMALKFDGAGHAGDREAYLVSGRVALQDDGVTVDAANSDRMLIYLDKETGMLDYTSPDRIARMGAGVDPQAEIDAALGEIEAQRAAVAGLGPVAEAGAGAGLGAGAPIDGGSERSAISRIPLHPETGEPMFEAADRVTAWDGLVEAAGGERDAADIAMAQIEQASADLEALRKKPPTLKAPKLKGSPMAMAQAKRDANEAHQKAMADYQTLIAEAEARQKAWNSIMGVYTSRNAERRAQEEAERRARDAQAHDEATARFEEEQRAKVQRQAEQEALGAHAVNPKIKARWDSAPKLEGNADAITLPDGSAMRGRYVLTEAGAASASHDAGNAYAPTDGFPMDENGQSVNDRDYQRDKDAQRIVEQMAGAYDSRALQTPVIVSKDGVVLSGNNRTMSGDLAARQGTDGAYVDYLREFGAKFGFTPEQVQGMKNPRLVFVPDETLPYDAAIFSRFNAQEMKSQSKPEAAVKLGKIVPDDVFESIVGDISRYDRMGDYYADEKASARALGALQSAGVINDKQMPEMRTGTALSAAGKELIENTLIGKVFQTSPDAVRQIISMPTLRQPIVMGLGEIAANRALGKSGYGLSAELARAVDLAHKAKSAMPEIYAEGVPVSPFGRQQGLFDDEMGESAVTDGVVLLLADVLNSGRPSDLRKVLAAYNAQAIEGASGQGYMDPETFEMMPPKTKETVLTDVLNHFKNATPREQQALVDAAIADRRRRAEAEQRGRDEAGEQTADAVRRSEESSPRRGGRETLQRGDAGQSDLQSTEAEGINYRLSDEVDQNGRQFVLSSNGTIEFGWIDASTGLTEAPLLLSEGVITNPKTKDGYGLIHIEARHGKQIRDNGYSSVLEFIESVAANWSIIREGKDRNGNQTYRLIAEDKHNNTLMVELSGDGTYWNINTAGIFKSSYGKNNREIYNRHTTENQSTETDGVSQDPERSGTAEPSSMGTPKSDGKDNALPSEKQIFGAESSLNQPEAMGAGLPASMAAEPSEAQKRTGNYRMEHRRVDGYEISIENRKGTVRRGKDANGAECESEMHNDYGYIRGTEGVDGDRIDVFLSDAPDQGDVFVVDQYNPDGSFDEHKVMYGFADGKAARDAYLANYEQGWEQTRRLDVTGVSKDEFKKWIQSSKRKTKPFAEYKSVTPIEENGVVGRSLTESEATELLSRMEAIAETAPIIDLTPENWIAQFGKEGKVTTPIGEVKMGENQFIKLFSRKRAEYFGMIKPTLTNPDVVLEEIDPKEGAERDSKYLFIKTFVKSDGSRIVHFESVTVRKDGMEVSISSHEIKDTAIKNKMQNDKILHLDKKLSPDSEVRLTETPIETEGPDLVPTSDNISSDDKVNTLSSDKQENRAESSKGYAITPATYTNKKGKETPMHRLEFGRELTREEESAVKKFASEKQGEGRFAPARGWRDRENGGWLFRTEEDARRAGEIIGNEEAVADHQPLSRGDIADAAAEAAGRDKKRERRAPANRIDADGLAAADKRDGTEPLKPQELRVTDEMKADEDILRDLLGIDDDEVGNVHFRDHGELTPEQKRKVYSVGVNYSLGYFDQGITSFPDFALAMVGRLGQKIKPWLKSFYEGAKRIPGYDESLFTTTEEVDRFDVANFDKPSADVLKQAEMIVAERKAKEATSQAEKEVIETRNQKRKEHDKQTEADTAALGEKAEAVASKAESLAETSSDRDELNRAAEEIDDTLDEVNDQLALLGYYEADLNAPEHEVYGLRRSAEKKAVKDATRLAKQLIGDLGIDLNKAAAEAPARNKKRNKPLAVSNLTGIDGDITINLPMPDGRNLHINIGLQPAHERGVEPHRGGGAWEGDNLEVDRIMYRFDRLNGRGDDSNHFLNPDVNYAQMLADIKRTAKWGMPKQEQSSAEFVKDMAERMERGESPYTVTPEVEAQLAEQRKAKTETGPYDDGGYSQRHEIKEREKNGFKVGEKVWYTRNDGKGKRELATIVDFGGGADVTLDTGMAPVMYEACEWSQIEKQEPQTPQSQNIFEEAAQIAEAAKAKREIKKTASSQKKQPEVKPEQPIGDLFSGLFAVENNNKEQSDLKVDEFDEPIDNEQKTDLQPRSGSTERERGHEPQQNEPLGKSQRNEAERTDGRGMGGRGVSHTVSDAERSGGVSRSHESAERLTPLAEGERRNSRNNHAERGTDYAPKGDEARIKANLEAIRLAKQLLESGEEATPKQMTILRKFSGWGGLGKAFNEDTYGAYNADGTTAYLRNVLTKLLGEQGFQDAIDSRRSAYYTPAEVIDTMWDIAKAMGFKGGNILEGSAGIGNILGLMPRELSDRSNIHAVEIDSTTGGILSLLYPDAKVEITGFQDAKIRNNSVDLAITNVPFVTGLKVFDHTGDKDLSTKFRDIHDFCIAKNIRKLREGGIGIFITSSGTMDNSARLRAWITNEGNADVVGAFRMHNKTFGGTGATSDIIVVRKRVNGRVSPNAIDITDVTGVRVVEYNTGDTRKVKGREVPIIKRMSLEFNKYFAEHPENMAGEMMFNFERGETYQPTSKALFPAKGKPQSEMLKQWASRFSAMAERRADNSEMAEEAGATESIEDTASKINEQLGEGVKEGSMVLNSQGELCMARMGEAVPLGLNKNKVKGHTKAECFKAYTAIKKALSDVLEYQSTHEDNAGLEPLLKGLNHAFDSFTRTYGNLHKNAAISFLRNDVDFSSILALETYSEKGDKNGNKVVRVGKTDIFTRRVIETEKEPQPTTIKDGILASLYKNGGVDVDYIADALGKPTDEARREIVESGLGFENPANGMMEVSYKYLSGNVREKLHIAQENNEDGRYDANIAALERALPMTIPAHLIEFSIGSSWIEPKLYEDFVEEKTGIRVQLTNVGGTWFMKTPWSISNEKNRAMAVVSKLCDKTIMGHELIEAAMTNRSITVSRTTKKWDGTSETITDREATNACSAKVDEIRTEFKDWARGKMQTDPEMSALIEHTYNERFNNYVPMSIPDEFVPTHFGGQVSELHGHPFALRPHQGKAVVRGTTEPVLLAHEVGTGKTFTLITTAMEMRRLGTARKPMIVVQNATVGQFVESAKEIYPNAKVLTIEEADRTAEGRKNFYAKIKYNDWDMIVVPQSVFERIPDSEERQMAYIKDIIEEKMMVLEAMRESDDTDGRNPIVRQAEKELADREAELADITKALEEKRERTRGKKRDEKKEATTRQNAEARAMEMLDRDVDDVENFDDMGIDAILVDEAHEYKHLGFATAMQRGVKGVDPSYSKKSQGVFLKTQAVLERNHGRNVVFATGTPISNTAAEIWTFMRYLMPADTMKEYGIYYFDDFVRNFGNISQMVEFKTSGKFDEVNRFAGYVNLPELVRIWSGVSDTVLTREAGGVSDKIPDIEGGKAQDIFLPQTRALRSVMKFVKKELQRYEEMTGKEKKENSHIPLTMYGIAKAAAVDARLVISDAEDDPNSKTNAAVRETLRSLEDSKEYKGTVAIFADNYQNKRSGFNLYEDIKAKLIKAGVPEEQIAIIKSGMTIKKKLDIFEKVNAGEIRVVMGSTFTLGTGVNIQERLHAAIHVDAPNRPMDYTQRNGRILRQGNLHKDMGMPVRVLRFGVEDSLDVTAYQRLKTKGAIADSIMNGSKMMQNSMENRVLEEEEDQFGDMTAQLSGSQYAILKNQAEREVRSLASKLKQHEIDQIYLHNSIPKEKGFIAGAERRIKIETANLETIGRHFPDGKIDKITIGKLSFDGIEAMEEFFKEQNAKKKEAADNVQGAGEAYHSTLTVNVNGLDFVVTTDIERVVSSNGQIAFDTSTSMTLECEELGIKEDVPYMRLKEAMKIIAQDIATGARSQKSLKDAQYSLSNHTEQLAQMEARYGKEFPFGKELGAAEERLEEYTEKMREEMMEKEKKYAEIDKGVEAASNVELTDEDETPSETNGDKTKFRVIDYDIDEYEAEPSNEKEERALELAGKLNTPITLITSADEIGMLPTSRQRHAKGWITSGGEIVIVVPNNTDVADIENTVVHEIVGHDGLEAMIGPERMDEFMTEVYDHAGQGIKKKIDARADKEYSDDIDRMTRQKGGGVFAKAEATVEANAKKRDGHYQREATKEYMADMAGEIGDKGFERMSQEELTLWGKIKVKVQQFLDKFLRGLKIAKSIRLTDKDLAYIFYKAWRHKRENGVFAKAEDIAMRRKTGYDRVMFAGGGDKENTAVEANIPKEIRGKSDIEAIGVIEGRYSENPAEKAVIATAEDYEAFLREMGLAEDEIPDALEEYEEMRASDRKLSGGYDPESKKIVIFAEQCKGVEDARLTLQHEELHHQIDTRPELREAVETLFPAIRRENERLWRKAQKYYSMHEPEIQREELVVNVIENAIKTGELAGIGTKLTPEEKEACDKLLNSIGYEIENFREDVGYVRRVHGRHGRGGESHRGGAGRGEARRGGEAGRGEGDDAGGIAHFRDGDGGLGLEETITKMKVGAMQANADNLQAKKDAMRAIGGNLNHLRRAMARQREYDISTVKSISDLAKILLDAGLLDDLSKYETKQILGTINNVVGKQDVSQYVQKVMDIMVDNQLRMGANALGKLLAIKGSRVDARGIEVQGELDPEGVAVAKVVRKSTSLPKDEIDNLIADAVDRMSSADSAIADEAAIEHAGLQLAHQFVENVTESKAEEKALRESIRQAKADKDAGQMDDAAYKQYVIATEDAIRQNKIERAEAYHELVEQVGAVLGESVSRAKAWREEQKRRIGEIHHNANSDMEGRPTDEHHKDGRLQKLANNSAVRFLLAPLGTFDQMLRMFGRKNARGEGYLWNRYMRGWIEATEKEYTGYRDALKRLDDKVSEVYGKKMKWGDLFAIDRRLPKANVRFWDGGEPKDHELTQGNLLYIYMADKMADGRMKLRKMGITESDIEDIRKFLDPHFLELADWMQEEFLVEKRNEYNEVHKRMFGASMAAIENYFPLKILANARLEEVDVADDTTDAALPATSTGSIIKRRRNNLALDVTGANAFSVVLDHLQQMERWAAFAEFNRDLNTLLSYKRFRNQVMNMSSVYGGGKTLWNNFRNVCSMAAGAYRPPVAPLDKAAVNIAKGVTAAKVSFRVFTALKQLLSMPAYLSDSDPLYLAANIANPLGAWKWSMGNLPLFEKRWASRMAGDPRLLKSEMDWKAWRSKVVQLASRVGMSPNAFVDALTVSIGAHSMYQTKKKKYLRWGMSEAEADKRARERLKRRKDIGVDARWLEEYEATKGKVSRIMALEGEERDREMDALWPTSEFDRYLTVKAYKHRMDVLTKEWLRAKTRAQRDSLVGDMSALKRGLVEEMGAQQ